MPEFANNATESENYAVDKTVDKRLVECGEKTEPAYSPTDSIDSPQPRFENFSADIDPEIYKHLAPDADAPMGLGPDLVMVGPEGQEVHGEIVTGPLAPYGQPLGVFSVQQATWSSPAAREAWRLDGRELTDSEWRSLQAMMGIKE